MTSIENETKEFLEILINEIEENGLMQYDIIHNGINWVLNDAKKILRLINQEQKAEDDRIDCLCDALNKIMDIEMGIATEYRVNVEDSEIYNTAHEAIQKTNPEYLTNPEYFITNKK